VIVALGLVAIGTVLIVTMDWDITLFKRFITSGDSGRSPIYSAAKDLFANHILFGTGWDGFRFYYEAKFGTNMDVHNVYLQLLCETGIVGFTVFCLFQVYCLVASIRLLRKSRYQRLSKSENGILRISLYIQLFYHISNYFENLLYSYSTFSIYLIACVIAINLSRKYECKRCNLSNRKEKTVLDAPVAQSLQVKIISLGD
jgi:O-antigen ligase